jgi:methyl-accepting chemotaxis protein
MLGNITVAKRLAFGFGALVLLGVCIAVGSAIQTRMLATNINEVANDRMVKSAQFTELLDNLNAIGRFARNILISDDASFREAEKKKIADLRAANSEILAELGKTTTLHVAQIR